MNWSPVYLSLKIAFYSTVITAFIGIPMGWLLARGRFIGKDILSSIVTLPMVLPPTVLGYYLLILIGRQSIIGRWLQSAFNINLVFTWQGAVLAATIVSLPLMIRGVQASIESVDTNLEDVARTLGKSEWTVFFRITLPLAWQGIVAGTVLAFARAMGEFGATLMVAGNIPGKTQTLSIAIYDAVQGGNYQQANFLVVLISVITIISLLLLNKFTYIRKW
ncbi:molybdate ABC transporter permease subunit [Natronincola ferrireducens]|uniref:Molybdenum transport system permease n=1 Tax=Natronincola ferrireducens TaxID=393762 RepID=A0A1G8ZSH3_9FIRM|nr:molybdate ABC transporter permease subunit [Natronincola ferrireducens]SDK17070.1 molybdate transport system permease protein [Natronincola ferrireducens]